MADEHHIRNPAEWAEEQLEQAFHAAGAVAHAIHGGKETGFGRSLAVRKIKFSDIMTSLAEGMEDFGACRTDVIGLCLIYPLAGLILSQLALNTNLIPLIFPLASGFALLGPLAAVGLLEMSRQREKREKVNWAYAFGVAESPAFGAIFVLGLILVALFLLWIAAAYGIYYFTLGPELPLSVSAFINDVINTKAGWWMIGWGAGLGFLFAVTALMISIVSFPTLLEHEVGVYSAIATSVRAVRENPGPLTLWGLIVLVSLAVASIPLLLGLIVVVPVLGHATWHLYRKLVPARATLEQQTQ